MTTLLTPAERGIGQGDDFRQFWVFFWAISAQCGHLVQVSALFACVNRGCNHVLSKVGIQQNETGGQQAPQKKKRVIPTKMQKKNVMDLPRLEAFLLKRTW